MWAVHTWSCRQQLKTFQREKWALILLIPRIHNVSVWYYSLMGVYLKIKGNEILIFFFFLSQFGVGLLCFVFIFRITSKLWYSKVSRNFLLNLSKGQKGSHRSLRGWLSLLSLCLTRSVQWFLKQTRRIWTQPKAAPQLCYCQRHITWVFFTL